MENATENCAQNSDDEHEINFLNRRKRRIVDSDSDTENTKQQDNSTVITNKSDSDDNSDKHEEDETVEETPKNRLKRLEILDSDPDDDRINTPISPDQIQTPHINTEPIYTTNKKNELILDNPDIYKSKLGNLCDPESSDDDDDDHDDVNTTKSKKQTKSKQRKLKKLEESNDLQPKKLMSGKEAAEQRKEIVAESQRMLRESRVSLPYHVPKTYSLKEFFEKRSCFASTINLPENVPPSLGIKMAKDQLEIVSKKHDERIKEVEEFYKTDSESETESDNKDVAETQTEIRNWLDILVDNAIDIVEKQNIDLNFITDKNEDESSVNYEFNLDNVEKSETNQQTTKLRKYAILKEKLVNIQPQLSGNPDEIIDLDSGITRPSEIKKLVDKYIEHTMPQHLHKDKIETSVISVNGDGIHQETVAIRHLDDDDRPVVKFEVPGAKLKKLKEKLINEMAEKRSAIWQQKNIEMISEKTNDSENKSDYEDDYLDDDEEEELTDTSSEDEIDDNVEYTEKLGKNQKCSFLDDEAEVDDDDDDVDKTEQHEEIEENVVKTKKLKRVIKGFNDDDSDNDVDITIIDKPNFKNMTQDEFAIPPNVPKIHQSPLVDKSKSDLDFLTPVTFITGLQNLNTEQKLKESPIISPFKLPTQPSPLRGGKWQLNLQKKLFGDAQQLQQEDVPTTQDLLEMCSGEFPDSQQQQQQELEKHSQQLVNVVSNDNQDDQVITQLLNEDDLEEFEKKLNSNDNEIINEIKATGIIDSDDENDELDLKQQRKKAVVISDESDDDDDDDVARNHEEIDLHDNTGLEDDNESRNINYDSEENEIVEEIKESRQFNVNDFVEQEAELSESEWDSADEDEKDLDQMEFEQGDKEEFDENEIRTDIQKDHMRRLLDDDTREIKLLQELLLEDGELHGTGRQRQFRWRNIDSVDDDNQDKRDDVDGIYLDDEENEEEWRKMRHKREMFLKQNSLENDDVDSILQNSKILTIGQKSIRTSQSFNNSQNSIKSVEDTDQNTKEPFSLSSKRGSFLSRNDHVLQRLAEYTKVSTNVVGTTKNSKSFLFQSVAIVNKTTKRKATEETPKALKKIRLTNFSPATDRDKPSSSKKLF